MNEIPICALLDSGSTHSFVNPEVIANLELPVVKTSPMVVMVANGAKMVTDTKCDALKFSLQGAQRFLKDMRRAARREAGCEMILGIDWLTSLGPMMVDWGKGKI